MNGSLIQIEPTDRITSTTCSTSSGGVWTSSLTSARRGTSHSSGGGIILNGVTWLNITTFMTTDLQLSKFITTTLAAAHSNIHDLDSAG